jgi:hypothetical protein
VDKIDQHDGVEQSTELSDGHIAPKAGAQHDSGSPLPQFSSAFQYGALTVFFMHLPILCAAFGTRPQVYAVTNIRPELPWSDGKRGSIMDGFENHDALIGFLQGV